MSSKPIFSDAALRNPGLTGSISQPLFGGSVDIGFGAPDAASRTGHDRDLSLQASAHGPLPLR